MYGFEYLKLVKNVMMVSSTACSAGDQRVQTIMILENPYSKAPWGQRQAGVIYPEDSVMQFPPP